MIRIKSKRHMFRRAGHAHPKGWTEYPDGTFTEEQIARFEAEPMLTVVVEADEPEREILGVDLAQGEDKTVFGELMQDEDGEAVIKLDISVDVACLQAVDAGRVTTSGKPTVEAIEEILGRNITAAERDEAWARMSETKEG